jgi:hypothetical protein
MLYLQNPPPRDDDDSVLYHYTDAAGLIGVLSSGTMWASDMRDLNDSAEITLQLKEAAQVLSTRPGDFPGWPENRHDVTSAIQMLSLPQPGYWFSASFSAEPDLLSQWRGYGGAKQSFAIGFDKGQLADAAMEVDATLYKCDYDAAIRSSRVDQAIQQGLIELERRPHSYLGFHIRDELQRTAALTKHESFSEEREYRLVVPHLPPYGRELDYRVRAAGDRLVSYLPIPLPRNLETGQLKIRRIVIGPAPTPQAVTAVEGALRQNNVEVERHRLYGDAWEESIYATNTPFQP